MSQSPPTLLILAAGIGSRYGGLKQLEPVGPSGEIIMDYSIHDALAAGFERVVFVIRRDFEAAFKAHFGQRYAARIACDYVYQELTALPAGFSPPAERVKPWGTGHAVLVAAEALPGPFAVINADDYYGAESLRAVGAFLRGPELDARTYAMVGFRLSNTLSEHGTVSRGVCEQRAGWLHQVTETTRISRDASGQTLFVDERGQATPLAEDCIVSMNLWGFHPGFLPALRAQFATFLSQRGQEPKAEFYLPGAVDTLIRQGQARVRVLPTQDKWYGVTYPQDKPLVQAGIGGLVRAGKYPSPLWS